MLLLVSSVKLIAEIALLALLGQWIVGLLAGARRQQNVFYPLLGTVGRPFVRLARWMSPRVVLDRRTQAMACLDRMLAQLPDDRCALASRAHLQALVEHVRYPNLKMA